MINDINKLPRPLSSAQMKALKNAEDVRDFFDKGNDFKQLRSANDMSGDLKVKK